MNIQIDPKEITSVDGVTLCGENAVVSIHLEGHDNKIEIHADANVLEQLELALEEAKNVLKSIR